MASAIVDQWNKVYDQFLDELIVLFPESSAKTMKFQFQVINMMHSNNALLIFIESVKGHGNQIMESDEEYFFKTSDIKFVKTLDLAKYYYSSNDDIKKLIWQYIQTMYMLSEKFVKTKLL